jgi:hypothetical protein
MSSTTLFMGEIPLRKWSSPDSDFGSEEKKTLKEILIYTDYDITVKVNFDGKSKEVKVGGKMGQSRVPINVRGHIFSIEFISKAHDCRIASPTIVFY